MVKKKYKIEFIFTEASEYDEGYDITVKDFIKITKSDAEEIGQKITRVKVKRIK